MTIHQNLKIRQGETWSFTYIYGGSSPVDLTDYSAYMGIKTAFGSGNQAYLSTGDDANGGTITLGGETGSITLSMTAAQTLALLENINYFYISEIENTDKRITPFVQWIYDLMLVAPDGTVTQILEGNVMIYRNVSA
jgi:hypothetical protein